MHSNREKIRYFILGIFDGELVNDVIPYIDAHFSTKKGRSNRAVAGLSLGSAQAALAMAKHPQLFSAFGVFREFP